VPLAMFANVAGLSVGLDRGRRRARDHFQILPVALGWRDTIDAGLARVFFSWTLHAIVISGDADYIAYYTIFRGPIGGRPLQAIRWPGSRYPVLVVAMPIGVHHLFTDPAIGAASSSCIPVVHQPGGVATLLTGFTICASAEIASRLRGASGAFGGSERCPGKIRSCGHSISLVMLGFWRRRRTDQYDIAWMLDPQHQWDHGHFHLIFAAPS